MINPYTCYILGFVVSLLTYQLGWSEIYPSLSYSLLIFLVVIILGHAVLSKIWTIHTPKVFPHSGRPLHPRINPWIVTGCIYLLWTADFIYEGGVPLFKMLWHIPFDYKKFGIPQLHVLAVSF